LLQVRRSTYHDVVKLAELGRLLDVAGIQTYVINAGEWLLRQLLGGLPAGAWLE
jgi:hypothetical protein